MCDASSSDAVFLLRDMSEQISMYCHIFRSTTIVIAMAIYAYVVAILESFQLEYMDNIA